MSTVSSGIGPDFWGPLLQRPMLYAAFSCLPHRGTQALLEKRETLGDPAPQDLWVPEDEM